MSEEGNNVELPIPQQWREAVCGILARRDKEPRAVTVSDVARRNWYETFPGTVFNQRDEAIIKALGRHDIIGKKYTDSQRGGEVYAFWFEFRDQKIYGKINLSANKVHIHICSTHPPYYGGSL